jgi:4-hydroxybenzoate polyprenyltransferase
MRVYSLTLRNRFAATLFVLGMIGLGAAMLFVGFAVIALLAAAGAVLGTGAAIYNRLRGRNTDARHVFRDPQLDPSLEVFPTRDAIAATTEAPRGNPED